MAVDRHQYFDSANSNRARSEEKKFNKITEAEEADIYSYQDSTQVLKQRNNLK